LVRQSDQILSNKQAQRRALNMISIEAKLNEALDKLKTISASKYKEV